MASSSSSEPALQRRQHSSSISSAPSLAAQPGPRRITLTIPPLKLKLSNHSADTTTNDVQSSSPSTANVRQTPKIKIKPRASFVSSSTTLVESPAQDVPSPVVTPLPPPPPPPPKAKPLPPPPKPKILRPVKLKPLKEVLLKLMIQIKKKDDYAFFLNPVDPDAVPGYSDVVKKPMDFGTMTAKIEAGRYRSLEQFKDDFVLVISNAKAFNPPSTLYHSEASRIEAWGLEHISRASAHVIEYETDWTIDVVADTEPVASTSDQPGERSINDAISATKYEEEAGQRARSPSVISSVPGTSVPVERARRSRSKKVTAVTESWEEDGHLPGHKDGIGAFPPRTDLSELMVELKLRGKRFRTKKERLRREKEGPPIAPDGSLNYLEIEHPFSVLQQLVPDPPSLPLLVPLIDAQLEPLESVEATPAPKEASQPPEEKDSKIAESDRTRPVRGPVSLPSSSLRTLLADSGKNIPPNPLTASSTVGKKRLKHWTLIRNPTRSRARELDETEEANGMHLSKRRRVAEATDYGSFASLSGLVAAEMGSDMDDFDDIFVSEEKLLDQLRTSLESIVNPVPRPLAPDKMDVDEENSSVVGPILDADEYIRDVVYGGIDGFAYVRSLAEFVCSDGRGVSNALGMSLARWVETYIVDPLTQGNHSVLRDCALALVEHSKRTPQHIKERLALASEDKSALREQLKVLSELSSNELKIDIAALLREPNELFAAEEEWSGAEFKARRDHARQEAESNVGNQNVPDAKASSVGECADVIEHALDAGAQALLELDRRVKAVDGSKANSGDTNEDALTRRTRLNLIAIAKRAPIELIAQLPPALVPPHIRHIVPTLSS